ncbi:serine/threonine protein kinase [Ignicoccus pacificus DSM 13166]|uniref:non-specific serine/threonine protein kinase n=1 Tax=Ignicoccus pacificus DSM 13166 TaxID=940294 RepID=A0A977KBD9_9CREN|nr:serine/threonine protein kinase [Ignicoccus pacificus DSM 13166]
MTPSYRQLSKTLYQKGAEAEIYLTEYWGCRAILKVRIKKMYRHPKVDSNIRLERTRNEALNMLRAYKAGVNVPMLYDFSLREYWILMEYIEGKPLREDLNEYNLKKAGEALALMHTANIAHWDYTTANILVNEGKIYVIDFGLSRYTESDLDKAIDIHLMIRSLLSAHPEAENLVDAFWEGYASYGNVELMKEMVRKIEMMGRYVKERRKTVW